MELWIIDRSGPYSSGPFDIHDEPDKFARAFVGYATMDDDVMGLDTFIERENGHRYITLDDASGDETRIRLAKAMVRQRAIVCRGTTCYETRNSHVAKLSWASDKRKLEVEQLKLAEERGVRGVARVVAHRQITTIAELREGLEFSKPHSSGMTPFTLTISLRPQQARTRQATSLSHRPITRPTTRPDPRGGGPTVRSRSWPRNATTSYPSPGTSRACTRLARTCGRTESTPASSSRQPAVSSATSRRSGELLESMRDATNAHRSLYVIGNILHRYISSNNIIITKPELADGCKGMLIDLDLAKVRDSGPSGARHQTGTMQFMAVEVLRKAGTGKSSLSLSVAGRFGLDIYAVSVSTVSDRSLEDLFAQLPPKCVVLLEDIDAAGATHSRDAGGENAHERGNPADTKSVTPSGLLNAIDGVASQEGRLLIMTTNHIEKLDGALIRPGRIDTQIKFQLVDRDLATQIYHFVFEQPD